MITDNLILLRICCTKVSFALKFWWLLTAVTSCISAWGQSQNNGFHHMYMLISSRSDTSYILPKSSLLKAAEITHTEVWKENLNLCENLILEIDLVTNSFLFGQKPYNRMKTGAVLDDYLNLEELSMIDSLMLQVLGYGITDDMHHSHPMVIETFLIRFLFDNSVLGFDMPLIQYAQKTNIQIIGLEDFYKYYQSFPPSTYVKQAERVRQLLSHENKDDGLYVDKYRQAFLSGNFEVILQGELAFWGEEQMNRMVFEKNERWTDIITKSLANDTFLLCVDAIHLPGDRGILSLLEKAGYRIIPH